jgi:hypothetical protein
VKTSDFSFRLPVIGSYYSNRAAVFFPAMFETLIFPQHLQARVIRVF